MPIQFRRSYGGCLGTSFATGGPIRGRRTMLDFDFDDDEPFSPYTYVTNGNGEILRYGEPKRTTYDEPAMKAARDLFLPEVSGRQLVDVVRQFLRASAPAVAAYQAYVRRREKYFAERVPAEPRLRDVAAGPPAPDWRHEPEDVNGGFELAGPGRGLYRNDEDDCGHGGTVEVPSAWVPPEHSRERIPFLPEVPPPITNVSSFESKVMWLALLAEWRYPETPFLRQLREDLESDGDRDSLAVLELALKNGVSDCPFPPQDLVSEVATAFDFTNELCVAGSVTSFGEPTILWLGDNVYRVTGIARPYRVSPAESDVLQAFLSSGHGVLDSNELTLQCGGGDPARTLRQLASSKTFKGIFGKAMVFPGKKNGGAMYVRIRDARDANP